jgi:rSAM/selenodomain-associated transferase 1
MKRTLIILLKEPRAGRVKTRLGREIGMTAAAWWFRHQTSTLLRRLEDPRWQILLSTAPDTATTGRAWPAHLTRLPQGRGDLGQRMARAIRSAPPGPTLLIGGDIPGVTPAHIWRAFQALGDARVVFGPATDGGFWLVGSRNAAALPKSIFRDARWSTRHALSDCLGNLHCEIAFTDMLQDVDTAADLRPGDIPASTLAYPGRTAAMRAA